MMADIIVGLIVVAVVGAAVAYIIRERKKEQSVPAVLCPAHAQKKEMADAAGKQNRRRKRVKEKVSQL